jgi:thioredoxin-related protein
MKKIAIVLMMCFVGLTAFSQGIEFEKITLKKAMKQAKKENKLIFIDVYTSWCGPCKAMAKNVFTDAKVGKFYNKHFVCLKVDAEKIEGMDIRKDYDVEGFPTLLYLDEKAKVIKKEIGGKSINDFMALGMSAMGLEIPTVKNDVEKLMMSAFSNKDYDGMMKYAKEYFEEIKGDNRTISMTGGAMAKSFVKGESEKVFKQGLEFCDIHAAAFTDGKLPHTYSTKGKLYLKLGNREKANEMFKIALDAVAELAKETGMKLTNPRLVRISAPIEEMIKTGKVVESKQPAANNGGGSRSRR